MILRRLSASVKQGAMILGLVALNGVVDADDAPVSASSTEQAPARQFGIYFGGMASQYDLCVKKGFLPKGDQSAEQMAKAILEKMRQFDNGPDQSAFVREGGGTRLNWKSLSTNRSTPKRSALGWPPSGRRWSPR